MSIYKTINKSDHTVTERVVYYSQSFEDKNGNLGTGSDSSIWHQNYASGVRTQPFPAPLKCSMASLYDSLLVNFYLSGSEMAVSESKFNNPYFQIETTDYDRKIHTNKFHVSGSGKVISIPQKFYGESIKPGSFTWVDKSVTFADGKTHLTLKDDGYGNIYSTNSPVLNAKSDTLTFVNYIGNIFYRYGVVVIHEPGEFSGSKRYSVASDFGSTFVCSFLSTKTIYASEYSVTINPTDFNMTNNPTAHEKLSGSFTGYLAGHVYSHVSTSKSNGIIPSKWSPYFNTVGFYDNENELVAVARYPQPIKVRDDIKLTCKIKLDF